MSEKEIRGLRTAAKIAGVSVEAMRGWCNRYPIARFDNGVWFINRRAMMEVVNAYKIVGIRR